MNHPQQPPGEREFEAWAVQAQDRFSKAVQFHVLLQRYGNMLRKRWWILFLSLSLVGGPAVYYAVIKPPTYQSQAIMWMAGKINLPEGRLYAEELTSYLGTQAELIKSPVIRHRALEKTLLQFPEIGRANAQSGLDALPFALSIKTSLKSSTLELRATGPSPDAPRFFLEEIMAEYLHFKRESRRQTSSSALSTITDQIKEVEKQVQEQQEALTVFETSHNISFLSESSLGAGSHLARLSALLSDLRTEHRLLELLTPEQFKDMADTPKTSSTGIAVPGEEASRAAALSTSPSESSYYVALQQLQLLKARRDDFAQVLRPAHSKMVRFNQEIAGLEKLLATLKDEGEQQVVAQMANRRKSLELQIENLEGQYRTWETNAAEASRKLAEHNRIRQQLQRYQTLYERLLALVQSVDLNKSLDQESLSPLGPASNGRATLTKYKIGAAGVFLGLMLGGGLLLLLGLADDRFTSLTELSLYLPEEIVGQVPESALARRGGRRRPHRRLADQHAFAESFRNLRSSLLCMSGQGNRPKVFVITSAVPKEGKTTVAANLATALAMGGARVLLVDADLRRSSLHKLLGARLKPGLREILTDVVSPAQAVIPTEEPNLFLIPAGEAQCGSADVFLRRPIEALLRQLIGQYDYIILDTAPVLATDDVANLGPKTDGVFMVVRASYTSSRMTREALNRLHKRKISVLGVIYNRAAPSSDYYYRYSSDYHSDEAVLALPEVAASKGEGKKAK